MNKKLLYIANIRFPTERAHGIQIAQMCNAFAKAGVDVELVVQRRVNVLEEDVFTYYDLPKSFRVTELATLDTLQYAWEGFLGRVSYVTQTLVYALHVLWYVRGRDEMIYSRDETMLFLLSFLGYSFAYEIHAPKWNFFTRRVVRKARVLFPISQGLKDFYIQKGVAPERLHVAPDAVDVAQFAITEGKDACRTRLGLPLDKRIVLYAGHLYKRKGAHLVAEAAQYLADDIIVVFVGGTEYEIPELEDSFGKDPHVRILGPKPHHDIPYYLCAADALVLPNTALDADSRLYTSPMKLFEYMASGTPIVASGVPSIREILDENNAYIFPPDDAKALATAITQVLSHKDEATQKTQKALAEVEKYSWDRRAQNILREMI